MLKQNLHENWTVRAAGNMADVPLAVKEKDIPATVPGCVHTDLLAAGLLDDPYYGTNELKQAWVGRTDWRYASTFDVDAEVLRHDRVELVCEGLDTVARVELNGALLGETADMHYPHRFNANSALRVGKNELVITFASPVRYAEQMRDRLGDLPHSEKYPFNFIRKMACNFGWDWGPALITSGIWQPIRLEAWNTARIAAVRALVQRADGEQAVLDVLVDLASSGNAGLAITATLVEGGGRSFAASVPVAAGATQARMAFTVPQPQLWWPRGHGAQPLYDLHVKLTSGDTELHSWSHRIGLRTARLNTDKDEIGSKFVIEVNGKPIFCKGANWIPDDCFLTRVDQARYRARLEQAVGANMNMLRVWGGGIFETDTFYELCSEMGIMVWQDFLFACAAYPEEEPIGKLVEAEARHNIVRLSRHASLVIWNGCNENIWGYFDWGWKPKLGGRTWGLGYYTDLLPKLVGELDPSRSFWPGSPYSGSMDLHPLDDKHGNKHVWDVWFGKDYANYRNSRPRFCSEFGFQGPPAYATLKHNIPARQLRPDSKAMLHHQKMNNGNERIHERLAERFDIPKDFDDWHYVMQLNQARALQTGVEWFRSRQPVCMGTLYWNINDCWPVVSWACVDGEGRPKPLWYATRRFFADRLLTIQPEADGALFVHASNDSDQPWRGAGAVLRVTLGGTASNTGNFALDVAPRSTQRLAIADYFRTETRDAAGEMLVAEADGLRAFWFYDVDKRLAYREPLYDAQVTKNGLRWRVKVTAKTFLRDLVLSADRLDPAAVVNDQLISLLPGESFTFEFTSKKRLKQEALVAPPVLQCANRFGKQGQSPSG